MANTGANFQNGAGRRETPGPWDDPDRAIVATSRPALKIVFVDSCPNRRSTRLRRAQTLAVRQSQDLSCHWEYGTIGGETNSRNRSNRCEASEDESDQEYDDEEARWNKRPRAGRNKPQLRKQKRHGKLAPADRDLLREARPGGLPHKPRKKKALRIATTDAVDLVAGIAEKIDWRQAVAAQHDLQTTTQELVTKSKQVRSGMLSGSSSMDEETVLAGVQLKEYWSDLLVNSVLMMMKTKEPDL